MRASGMIASACVYGVPAFAGDDHRVSNNRNSPTRRRSRAATLVGFPLSPSNNEGVTRRKAQPVSSSRSGPDLRQPRPDRAAFRRAIAAIFGRGAVLPGTGSSSAAVTQRAFARSTRPRPAPKGRARRWPGRRTPGLPDAGLRGTRAGAASRSATKTRCRPPEKLARQYRRGGLMVRV